MNEMLLATGTCFVMGIITTLHPCPFTTNIAAISLLTSWSGKSRRSAMFAFLFVSGYLMAFILLSVMLGSGIYAVPEAGSALQAYVPLFIGPILIIAGMLHADIIRINRHHIDRVLARISGDRWQGIHALPLGFLMALSFCPATAAIFFGMLVPLALQHGQIILFPLVYALGAALPLIGISFSIVQGVKLSTNNLWQRRLPILAGWVLIISGIYLAFQNIYMPLFKG